MSDVNKRDIRVGVFVDVANIHAAATEQMSGKLDYEKLMSHILGNKYKLFRAIAYAVKFSDDIENWIHTIEGFGYEVRSKEPTELPDGKRKANWDVDLCLDVVEMIDLIDMVIIVSGDGDFVRLVNWCQHKGRIVKVYGVKGSVNRTLSEVCNQFVSIGPDFLLQEK